MNAFEQLFLSLSKADQSHYERICSTFENDCQANPATMPEIARYLPPAGTLHDVALVALAKIDMEVRRKRGAMVLTETYRAQFPKLDSNAALLELTAWEFSLSSQRADALEGLCTRFPALAQDLRAEIPRRAAAGAADECWFLDPAKADGELGRLGPYRVLKLLGKGGMGMVFLAEHAELLRKVALKTMRSDFALLDSAEERFRREAQALAKLKHDNIVAIHEFGRHSGILYLVMDYSEGEGLDTRIARDGPLPSAEVMRIGIDVANGLIAAHAAHYIHRDLKPSNIWLEFRPAETPGDAASLHNARRDYRAKILDFGVVALDGQIGAITDPGVVPGSTVYMSPEQARKLSNVGAVSDLFTLGVILYQVSTGRLPFKAASLQDHILALQSWDPPAPSDIEPNIPRALSSLIMRLLAKNPDARPQSAREVKRLLEGIRDGAFRTRSQRLLALVAAATVLVTLVAVGVFFFETPNGTVRIEINDAKIQATLDKDGFTIRGAGAKEIRIEPGKHWLRIACGGESFETKTFELRSGETVSLSIHLLEDRVQVLKGGKPFDGKPMAPAKTDLPQISAKQARAEQEACANRLGLPIVAENSIGMKLVLIPEGKFLMGSPATESRASHESPQHEVVITQPFYLGMYEVTQREFVAVMGHNPSSFKLVKKNEQSYPVNNVCWEDAVEFCRKLTALEAETKSGRVYRLPTEAQWEYACRAGSQTPFHFGDPMAVSKHAWHLENSGRKPHAVGQLQPNGWRLHDMCGNQWEWCFDRYGATYYARSPKEDPQGPTTGEIRVLRGGSFNETLLSMGGAFRSAYRHAFHTASERGPAYSFRVACLLPSATGQRSP